MARVRNETDLELIHSATMDFNPELRVVRVGVFKDAISIAQESAANASLEIRRQGWVNADGSDVPPNMWVEGAPFGIQNEEPGTLTLEAVYAVGDGLTDQVDIDTVCGIVYECCPSHACDDFMVGF